MKKAVVTGANGFIGTALCRELSAEGMEIYAVVRGREEDISGIDNLPKLKVVYSDMADFRNLADKLPDGIDILYHLAWAGSAGILRGDADIQVKNVQYACDTVKACADMGCPRLVFASSIMEFEIEALMKTDSTPAVNTLYCSAKVAADYMARTIAGVLGIDYIRAVISNVYGPEEMSPRLINTSLRKMLNKEHCSFSAGEQTYDFIYITDAAKAFVSIGKEGVPNRTYYIGSQSPRPLKEFLYELRDQVDPEMEIGIGELPFTGVSLTYNEFDIYAVKNDTAFVPKVSFAEGIRKTMDWIRENG